MKKQHLCKVELTIEDVMALVEHYDKMYNSISPTKYSERSPSGKSWGHVASHYLSRRMHFNMLLDYEWPK